MERFGAVVLLVALAGCQTAEESVPGPSGQMMQQTKCSRSPNQCFKTAAATCGGSYQVLDSSSNSGGLLADALPGPVTWYRMSYQCGRSDGRMPDFPFQGQQYTPPPVVMTQPRTTNCTAIGNTVSCNSY